MTKLHNDSNNRQKNIHTLQNDHIDAVNKKSTIQARRKAARNRRLAVFFVFATFIIGFLGKTLLDQNERLDEKQKVLNERQTELEEVLETQEYLKLQLAKLDDDEYIGKLARKELFLSEEGEIIFTIPKKSKEDKSDDEQEEENE